MPTPLQHVHRQHRRVSHLHKKDFVAGNLGDSCGITLERERMKAVEQYAEGRMIDLTHQIPHLLPGVHVTPPSQGLVTDPQVARTGALGQQRQIVQQNARITQRVTGARHGRRYVAGGHGGSLQSRETVETG